MKHLIKQTLSVLCWLQFAVALYIYVSSAIAPFDPNADGLPIHPTLLHVIGNIFLTLSAYVALNPSLKIMKIGIMLFIISSAVELAQYFVPSRTLDPFDLLANYSGVLIGYGIIRLFEKPVRHIVKRILG